MTGQGSSSSDPPGDRWSKRKGRSVIEQLLNRQFMLAVADGSREVLADELARRTSTRRGGAPGPLDDFATADLAEFATALAEESERFPSAAASPVAPSGEDFVFLPHSPLLSILQSAVDEAVQTHQPDAIEVVERRGAGRRGTASPAVTARRLKGVELGESAGNRRVWKQMEVAKGKWIWLSDPRWALSLACQMWRDGVRGRTTFVNRPATIRMEKNAKVIVIGDWGSGLPRALDVAAQVRAELERDDSVQRIVIHLGDVYYSGTQREFVQRFLDPWPVAPGSDVISLSVPGNHELYSGGFAFFDRALADDRFKRQNGCSYFALQNDHWQLLGLDTAYEDAGLHGEQVEWARQLICNAEPQVKTCLLSHHQLFSAHEAGARLLQRRIEPVLATERVDAWLWGHEHRCIEYGSSTYNGHRIGFASCVGHGGIPEYLVMREGERRPDPWRYEYLTPYDDGFQPWGTFGFAVLDVREETMSIRYINERGEQHHAVANVVSAGS